MAENETSEQIYTRHELDRLEHEATDAEKKFKKSILDFGVAQDYAKDVLPHFTCPVCHMTSYNKVDVRDSYCGSCHAWTGQQD